MGNETFEWLPKIPWEIPPGGIYVRGLWPGGLRAFDFKAPEHNTRCSKRQSPGTPLPQPPPATRGHRRPVCLSREDVAMHTKLNCMACREFTPSYKAWVSKPLLSDKSLSTVPLDFPRPRGPGGLYDRGRGRGASLGLRSVGTLAPCRHKPSHLTEKSKNQGLPALSPRGIFPLIRGLLPLSPFPFAMNVYVFVCCPPTLI